jgi:hypothetical protein
MNDLPWIEEIRNMSDALQLDENELDEDATAIENQPMRQLTHTAREIVLFCLAHYHHWSLGYDGQLASYVAELKSADRQSAIKAWEFHAGDKKPSHPHIRCGLWKTENGLRHRYLLRLGNGHPGQTAKAYAAWLDGLVRPMFRLKTDYFAYWNPQPASRQSFWCISHEVFQ